MLYCLTGDMKAEILIGAQSRWEVTLLRDSDCGTLMEKVAREYLVTRSAPQGRQLYRVSPEPPRFRRPEDLDVISSGQ